MSTQSFPTLPSPFGSLSTDIYYFGLSLLMVLAAIGIGAVLGGSKNGITVGALAGLLSLVPVSIWAIKGRKATINAKASELPAILLTGDELTIPTKKGAVSLSLGTIDWTYGWYRYTTGGNALSSTYIRLPSPSGIYYIAADGAKVARGADLPRTERPHQRGETLLGEVPISEESLLDLIKAANSASPASPASAPAY